VLAFDRWTTQQYASLCAELSVFQAHSREVLARYHLEDDAARRRLDQDWERRVASDPQLGQEIQRLYTAYRAYLIKA
jgi:primosomal protein N''